MATHYFIANDLNLDSVYQQLLHWFKVRQYEVNGKESKGEYLIQARKTSLLRTFTGTNLAFKVRIHWSQPSDRANEFVIETTTGKWISNFAGAGITSIFTGGLTIITGLAGAGWTVILENSLVEYVENSLQCTRIKPELSFKIDNPFSNVPATDVVEANSQTELSAREKAEAKVKIELQKLERAYQAGILEPTEYFAKKTALEATVERYEIDFAIEAQIAKLEQAFIEGILDEREYEAKVASVAKQIEEQILQQRLKEKQEEYIAKLKQSLKQGVLSQAEYEAKIASLDAS
ncbi:hypothetical protein [Myxosarcina sp. GI1]|uniref:hypothetical protein n=1 Tax=Myxosarcina sp. GI1 TaxID=1541065 RepID=UPI000564273C|nr:hypothetical protein [Myxosarcina sp. GI1]